MKKFISLLLTVIMIASLFCLAPISTSAASNVGNTGYSAFNQPEKSGDYAYWNGSRVVKSGSTSKSEIKWMQAALNYCVMHEGLATSYIDVDGSFGPATKKATLAFQAATGLDQDGSFGPSTIKKMISVLNDGKKSLSRPITVLATNHTIYPQQIKDVYLSPLHSSFSLYVDSDATWSVKSNADWLTVKNAYRSGDRLDVSCSKNFSIKDRTATVTITNQNGMTYQITFRQAGNEAKVSTHEHTPRARLLFWIDETASMVFASVLVCDGCGAVYKDSLNKWSPPIDSDMIGAF